MCVYVGVCDWGEGWSSADFSSPKRMFLVTLKKNLRLFLVWKSKNVQEHRGLRKYKTFLKKWCVQWKRLNQSCFPLNVACEIPLRIPFIDYLHLTASRDNEITQKNEIFETAFRMENGGGFLKCVRKLSINGELTVEQKICKISGTT